jgi:PAT family beta-lactamase induction signal transducer AmpG
MGTLDPRAAPFGVALLAFAIAFLSASQDVVVDAYRTELLPAAERASGTAIFVAAYRVALIAAGAGALILSDQVSWTVVYWLLAALMGIGIVTTLLAPVPEASRRAPRTLQEAVVEPFREFLKREHAFAFLWIIMLYKAGDVVAGHLLIPFMQDLGFSNTEVGAVLKGLGLGATIVGSLLGGGLVAKWGLRHSLIVFGVLQAVANAAYAVLAAVGKSHALMTLAITLDNLMNGMGTAAFVALLMTLCNKRYTATQYALFSSLMTVPGRVLGVGSGWLAEQVGWTGFFLITIAAAAPALGLLLRVAIEEPSTGPAPPSG